MSTSTSKTVFGMIDSLKCEDESFDLDAANRFKTWIEKTETDGSLIFNNIAPDVVDLHWISLLNDPHVEVLKDSCESKDEAMLLVASYVASKSAELFLANGMHDLQLQRMALDDWWLIERLVYGNHSLDTCMERIQNIKDKFEEVYLTSFRLAYNS